MSRARRVGSLVTAALTVAALSLAPTSTAREVRDEQPVPLPEVAPAEPGPVPLPRVEPAEPGPVPIPLVGTAGEPTGRSHVDGPLVSRPAP